MLRVNSSSSETWTELNASLGLENTAEASRSSHLHVFHNNVLLVQNVADG